MEGSLVVILHSLASILNFLADLIDRYPWIGVLITLSPALPALLQRSVLGTLLCAALGFVGMMVLVAGHGVAGPAIWGSAWGCSIVIARARRQRRLLAQLLAIQRARAAGQA